MSSCRYCWSPCRSWLGLRARGGADEGESRDRKEKGELDGKEERSVAGLGELKLESEWGALGPSVSWNTASARTSFALGVAGLGLGEAGSIAAKSVSILFSSRVGLLFWQLLYTM